MLKSSPWMVQIDERILEDLRESGTELTAWEVAFDLGAKTDQIRHRCDRLTHAGFLHRRDRGDQDPQYSLTLWGALYLDGEVDADLRRPAPRPRPSYAVRPRWFVGLGR